MITTAELRRVMNRLGESPPHAELINILNEVDPQGKGLLDFQQFIRILSYFDRGIITEEEITEAFKVFDRDGSGPPSG